MKHYMLFSIFTAVLFLSLFLTCLIGAVSIAPGEIFRVFLAQLGVVDLNSIDPSIFAIIWDIRFSRILLSALVGCALAISGAAFQGVLINPLADPFTIGVASGAAFGATLAIFLGSAFGEIPAWVQGLGIIPIFGFLGAMVALFFVIAFSRLSGGLRRETMILSGIVVATFLSALISLLKALDEESVQAIVFWIMGSLQGRSWAHVGFAMPYIVCGIVMLFFLTRELDIMTLGDEQAKQLGVNVEKIRYLVLIGASILTAACVSVSGVIGFVGLVIPHMVRLGLGARHTPLFIGSGLLGAITMIWSDAISRSILPGGEEIPVGVITALIGGPVFFLILVKSKKEDLETEP
ncbi:FecCD family ABC transporter permease [Dissulfuribacter thermophilus]|nr:iron ABC transporter permease [Dissulfuribacter thermophilus]